MGGAAGSALSVPSLRFPELAPHRERVLDALIALCHDESAAMDALKLGPRQAHEVAANRGLRASPVLSVMERYTGVLFDAVDVASLSAAATRFCAEQVVVHSALFGLVGGSDLIPAYRLSHNSRVPGVPLLSTWSSAVADALERSGEWVVDLRSEAYVKLGPAPPGRSVYVRVVSRGPDGVSRALNHFNKKAKGEFVRAVAESGVVFAHPDQLLEWAVAVGVGLTPGRPGELELDAAQASPWAP